jgi:tetrahydromethanopterin S-methyltransferase subunit E
MDSATLIRVVSGVVAVVILVILIYRVRKKAPR